MKKLLSILLVVVMFISIFAVVPFSAGAATGAVKMKHYMTYSMKQSDYSKYNQPYGYNAGCCAMSYAIGLSIVTGQSIEPTQFWYNGTTNYTMGKIGSYVSYNANTLYQSVYSGKPVMLHYKNGSNQHWVLVIGASDNSLSTSSFICIDPVTGTERTLNNCWAFGGSVSGMRIFTDTAKTIEKDENTHTHNYSTYVYYWASHPHYKCYKCSCDEVKENNSQPMYLDTCSSCNLTVNYNANGGTGAPASQTKKYLSDLILSEQTPYREGYAFCGWSTSSTANEVNYVPGHTYTTQSALTLYAVWKQISVSSTEEFGGHTYKYFDLPISWIEAYNICESLGGHLVTISSKEENDFVLDMADDFDNLYCWIGATDYGKEGSFYWTHAEPFSYTNWSASEPNNTDNNENFTEMYVNTGTAGTWNDSDSAPMSHIKTTGFICEFDNDIEIEKYVPSKTFTYNDHIYEIYDYSVDWQTAKSVCETKGGHLVTFSDSAENKAIYNAIQSCSKDIYWLGYTDVASEGDWRSVDAPNDNLNYTNWNTSEPNNYKNIEDCASIRSSGVWNDLDSFAYGYVNIGFICEYENVNPEATVGDVDGDADISIMDATLIQQAIAKQIVLTDAQIKAADTDKDGDVSIMDATQIQLFIAKLITEF